MKKQQKQDLEIKKGKYSKRLSNKPSSGFHEFFRTDDEFYHMLVESIDGYAIFTTDKNGIVSSWNTGAEKLLQHKEKEIIGKNAAVFFTKEDIKRKAPESEIKDALEKGKAIDERWHVKKDGTTFWGSGLMFCLKDEKNEVRGFTKIFRDLTNQKAIETERSRYSAIFQNAPAFICIVKGKDHTFELANKHYDQLIGFRDIVGKTVKEALPEVVDQGFIEVLDAVYNTGKPFIGNEIKISLQRKKNAVSEERYLNFVYQPIKEVNNSISGIFVHGVDITEQVISRQKIEKSQKDSEFLAEASKVLSSSLNYQDILKYIAKLSVPYLADFCVFDVLKDDNTIQRVTWQHVDKTLKEYIKVVKKFAPKSDYVDNPVAYSLKVGKTAFIPYVDEAWLQKAATTPQHLEFQRKLGYTSVLTVPLKIRGNVSGNLAFIHTKVSNRHHTKSDIHVAEELSYRASIAIENSHLYEIAQKEIKERKKLEKQKDEFIGMATHELKTPVTSLKAYAQVLERKFTKAGDTTSASNLAKMNAQLDKLTNLISDLLDSTKIDTGKLYMQAEVFSFDELVAEIVEEMQRTSDKHNLIIKSSTNKKIFADRERIGQVLTNLISNAIKYSPHNNKIFVELSTEKKGVKVCVKDFGVGIPTLKQKHVFERFYRVSGPKENTFPGLGLGLYISSEIIKREGGRIWVESDGKNGSTFCFTIPLKKQTTE